LPTQIEEVTPGINGLSPSVRQSLPSKDSKAYPRFAVQTFQKWYFKAASRRSNASSNGGIGLAAALVRWAAVPLVRAPGFRVSMRPSA
jgi:hypothetical protein